MIKKIIEIDGRQVPFRASATVPRLYRACFGRDIFKDLMKLDESFKKQKVEQDGEKKSELDIGDLELFENVAFIMAKHAEPGIPDTPEEWLDEFDTFSIYLILPQILELWNLNMRKDSEAKKKTDQLTGK